MIAQPLANDVRLSVIRAACRILEKKTGTRWAEQPASHNPESRAE